MSEPDALEQWAAGLSTEKTAEVDPLESWAKNAPPTSPSATDAIADMAHPPLTLPAPVDLARMSALVNTAALAPPKMAPLEGTITTKKQYQPDPRSTRFITPPQVLQAEWQKLGIEAPSAAAAGPISDLIERQSTTAYMRFMEQSGFKDVVGDGVEEAKQQVRAGLIAAYTAGAAGVYGQDRLQLAKRTVSEVLMARLQGEQDQLGGMSDTKTVATVGQDVEGKPLGRVVEDNSKAKQAATDTVQRHAAIVNMFNNLPDKMYDYIIGSAVAYSKDEPSNEWERKLFQSGGSGALRRVALDDFATKISQVRYWQSASSMPEIPKDMDNGQLLGGIREVLGENWKAILTEGFDARKLTFVRGKLGINDKGPIASPGFSDDGVNFVDFIPSGALKVLQDAQTSTPTLANKALNQMNPAAFTTYAKMMSEGDEAGAATYQREVLAKSSELLVNRVGQFKGMEMRGTPEPDLTPAERESMTFLGSATSTVLKAVMDTINGAANTSAQIDRQELRNVPLVRDLSQMVTKAWTNDNDLSEVATTPFRAAEICFKHLFTNGALVGHADFAKEHPELADAKGPEKLGLLRYSVNPMKVFEENYGHGQSVQSARLDRLNKAGLEGGLSNPIGAATDMLKAGVYEMYISAVQSAYMLMDDPSLAPGMLLGMKGVEIAGAPLKAAASATFDRMIYSAKLSHQLSQVAKFYPEKSRILLETVRDRLKEAVDAGEGDKVTAALRNSEAIVRTAVSDLDKTGAIKNRSEFADSVKRVWPEIGSDLGVHGLDLGSKSMPLSVTEAISAGWNAITGRESARPDARLAFSLKMGDVQDSILGGIKTLLGSDAQQSAQLRNNVQLFMETAKRAPTMQEMKGLLPQSLTDLNSLILSSSKVDLKAPLVQRTIGRLFGWKGADQIGNFVERAETTIQAYTRTALDTVNLHHEWGQVRARNRLLHDVAENSVQGRIDQAEYKMSYLKGLSENDPTGAGVFNDLMQQTQTELAGMKARRTQIQTSRDRLNQGSFQAAFRLPSDSPVLQELQPQDMSLILEAHPHLFEGVRPEALWDENKLGPNPDHPVAVANRDTARTTFQAAQEKLRLAREADPIQTDGQMQEWTRFQRELESQKAGLEKAGAVRDPSIDDTLDQLRMSMESRAKRLRAGEAQSSEVHSATLDLQEARTNFKDAIDRFTRTPAELTQRTINPDAFTRLRNMFNFDGPSEVTAEGLARAKEMRAATAMAKQMGLNVNPLEWPHLPAQMQGDSVYGLIRAKANHLDAANARLEDMLRVVREQMTPQERKVLGLAQRAGRVPTELCKDYPAVDEYFRQQYAKGVKPGEDLVSRAFNADGALLDQVFQMLSDRGAISDSMLRDMKSRGYDPVKYGLQERPGLVRDENLRSINRAIGGGARAGEEPGITELDAAPTQLKFARQPGAFRLRIDEPERIINQVFSTEEAAQRWYSRHYGEELKLGKNTDGIRKGQTPFGDRVQFGDPLTKSDLAVLDPVLGKTPELRLEAIKDLFASEAAGALTDALNAHGGLVLDREQWIRLQETKNQDLMGQFVKMPENERAFGAMSGKMVHRSVVSELNRQAVTYNALNSMMAGMREAWLRGTGAVPADAVAYVPGLATKAFMAMQKSTMMSQITYSLRSWLVNPTFNVFCDHVAGTGVFDSRNAHNLDWAYGMADPRRPGSLEVHPIVDMARRNGIVGSMFEQQGEAWQKLGVDIYGMNPKEKAQLAALRDRRTALLTQRHTAELAGSPTRVVELEKEVAAIDVAFDEATKGRMQKIGEHLVSFWLDNKNALGQRPQEWSARLKSLYNFIDERHKLAALKNLIDSGVSEAEAVATIRTHFQDYTAVPYALKSINPIVRSTIVSFPYEALRLVKNAFLYKPSRALGFFSIIPALNFTQAVAAGVSPERMAAIDDARGAKDMVTAAMGALTKLRLYDPRSGNVLSEFDFSGAIPYGGVLHGNGFISQIYDDWVPPEKRNVWGSAGGLAAGAISNIFMNNPAFGALAYMATGRDPGTGQLMVDKQNTDLGRRAWDGLKILGMGAGVPMGRDAERIYDAFNAPINPVTGKPFRSAAPTSAIIKGLTGIGVKGDSADRLAYALGLRDQSTPDPLVSDNDILVSALHTVSALPWPGHDQGTELPTDGAQVQLKRLALRALEDAPPDKKAAAQKAYDAALRENVDINLKGVGGTVSRSDRQVMLEKARIADAGLVPTFNRLPIHAQAAFLAYIDQFQIPASRQKEFINNAIWGGTSNLEWKGQDDPGMLQMAIKFLDKAVLRSDVNPELIKLRAHLKEELLPIAQAKFDVEQQMQPVKEDVKKLMDGIKRGM